MLELASVLAGPSVGQFFAEVGARVIKVENPGTGGDVTRSWKNAREQTDDRSAYFTCVNWGKQSVALNLLHRADYQKLLVLVRHAHIIIASYKPGDARKLGVDYETLAAVNPRIIYGQITGYGSHNERVGYDAVVQAESGFMEMNGTPDGPPVKMPVALIDVLAGHQLKEALLLAWIKKQSTGAGSFVEVSLWQTAIASLANQASNYLVGAHVPQRQGSAHPNIAPYGDVFTTADGRQLLLAVGSDKQFAELCAVLSLPALATDARFAHNAARVENRQALCQALDEQIKPWPANRLLDRLHASKIPAGLLQRVDEALQQPETTPLLMDVKGMKGVRTFVGASAANHHLSAPPHVGEHTQQVFNDFDIR